MLPSHISRLASRDAAKSLLSTLVSESSGECRLKVLTCTAASLVAPLAPFPMLSGPDITVGFHEIGLGERVGAADRIQICKRREHVALRAPGT